MRSCTLLGAYNYTLGNMHLKSRHRLILFTLQIMPLRHVADETGHVSIVNPQAVDLKSYEEKLSAALDKVQE